MTIKQIKLYYDTHEKHFGDRFYPVTERIHPSYQEIYINFKFIDGCWAQINCNYIKGFDEFEKFKVLKLLNENESVKSQIILNLHGYLL